MGRLYVVATPIGNLEDITLRALRLLQEVRLIAAEDTRHTRTLLDRYGIETPVVRYDEHSHARQLPVILRALEQGEVALVSDAGTPGISDPGAELVRAAVRAGHTVSPVPGPSAVVAAIAAAGMPAETFLFLGYLPRRASDRVKLLAKVADETRTMVAFEVPHRLRASLSDLEEALGAERVVALAREVSKVHEEFIHGTLGEVGVASRKRHREASSLWSSPANGQVPGRRTRSAQRWPVGCGSARRRPKPPARWPGPLAGPARRSTAWRWRVHEPR